MFKYIIISTIITLLGISISPLLKILTTSINIKLSNKMQNNLFNHLIRTKDYNLNEFTSMSVLSRFSSDISTISNLVVSIFPKIISSFFLLTSSFVVLFVMNKFYAFIAILFLPGFILLSKIYSKKQKSIYKKIEDKIVEYKSFVQESILNSVILKIFMKPENISDNLNIIQQEIFTLQLKKIKLNCLSNFLVSIGMNIGYLIIFIIGAFSVCFKITTIGSFSALVQLFQKVQSQLRSLSGLIPQIIFAVAALERIHEIYDIPLEPAINPLPKNFKFKYLKFNDVSFFYDDNKPCINDINFSIHAGDIIGLVGSSGIGKTTILKLLMFLLEPKKGFISVNDTSLKVDHRALISYVPQSNNLFSGTIRNNLTCGNNTIKDDDIKLALKISCAYDFVKALPKGLQTKLGENGVGLSQGQCQRLAITRAILSKKEILILDEATSALDLPTESQIIDNINNLKNNMTVILITHRTSTLKNCNKILELKDNLKLIKNNSSRENLSAI